MRPLILITNDDGYDSKGLKTLISVAQSYGDVVVVAPEHNASGLSHSFTAQRPLRVREISSEEGLSIYACDGTPVDCVKLGQEYFCPRTPSLVLSGINHGSNSSINILYSGTMGAVLEASLLDIKAVGFSLVDYDPLVDFTSVILYIKAMIGIVLENPMPSQVCLNVNIPRNVDNIKGIRLCRQSKAQWIDCYRKCEDPRGVPYYWIDGEFVCDDNGEGTDQYALEHGYISIVPTTTDFTAYSSLDKFDFFNSEW